MKKNRTICIAFVMLFASSFQLTAQFESHKVLYILSLSKNIEWPSEMRQGMFRIGVYGSPHLYRSFAKETLGRTMYNQNVEIFNLNRLEIIRTVPFNVIYIAEEACTRENLKTIKKYLGNSSTLIITEKEKGLHLGSAINFIVNNGKLQYELNLSTLTGAGLKSSKQIEKFAFNMINTSL